MAADEHLTAPDPVAHPRSVIEAGRYRVSVLTDRLVRIEYAADQVFEDRATPAVCNRRFGPTRPEVRRDGDALTVDSGALRLHVDDVTRAPSRTNLTATIGRGRSAVRWHHGQRPRRNLGGTRRTLDGWRGREREKIIEFDPTTGRVRTDGWVTQHLDPGLLSRDGWVVVDDSASVVLDPHEAARRAPDLPAAGVPVPAWPTARPPGRRLDCYLFAHGTDHAGALADAARLFGPQPLPPRWAFGYWYSRYYAYTDRDLEALADRFDELDLPLDVLVVDMDWHLPGWTGYSWDRRYFPDPDDTLARLRARGLRLSLNLHPADGVGRHEDAFEAVCADLGLDPTRTERVPFDVTDPRFIASYFGRLHHPEERRGVDFWWMDWQQGKRSAIEGLDPLRWLNTLHWCDQAQRRPERRPVIFSRWGGLGSGRMPVGFSGDAWSVWESLAYQPEFTATAANVLYGYWSHDIGGHYGPPTTPELYTRWMQFGVHSPVLRTHGSKDPAQERRVWDFPDPYRAALFDALRRRYELVPYLYGEARRAGSVGGSLVRPMYHAHPDAEAAYEATGQYLLGATMLVAPVTEPCGADAMAAAPVWLPRGDWVDTATGRRHRVRARAGRWVRERYLLEEVPVHVPAGSVIPGQRDARRLDAPCYRDLTVTAHPGGDGRHDLYEDDGVTVGYQQGESAVTPLRQRLTAQVRRVAVGPTRGDYPGWERRRSLEVRFVGEPPPQAVRVGARPVRWSTHPDERRCWWYDAAAATVVVRVPSIDLRAGVEVHLDRAPDAERLARRLEGMAGLTRRLDRIAELVGVASPHLVLHPDERLAVDLAQAANRVSRDPSRLESELRRVRRELRRLDGVLVEFQEAWRGARVASYSDPRETSIGLLADARAILATTLDQFAR
jgi:hypothetical protein